MNRIVICFMTKDRVELSERTIEPLLQSDKFDLFILDGSKTVAGQEFPYKIMSQQPSDHRIKVFSNVVGGPDAAAAFAFTTMLASSDYEYCGIVENDVLLHPDWLGPTMGLFARGAAEGLSVGAVSARCYEDRILIQRDGFSVVHNIGFGSQILTREAATIALRNIRTGLTSENRRLFCQLTGKDIGDWFAFRKNEGHLCADWHQDVVLASHGLASLALVPSPVEMIGQNPPLQDQGLKIADEPFELLRDDAAFSTYVSRLGQIRSGAWTIPSTGPAMYEPASGAWTVFAHQVRSLGADFTGDWRLKWQQGFGPFGWMAGDRGTSLMPADLAVANQSVSVTIPLSGPCEFLVSGGDSGGQFELEDLASGYTVHPALPANDLVSLPVPTTVAYRKLRLTALTPGVVFYGIRTREPQPFDPRISFDHNTLPPV